MRACYTDTFKHPKAIADPLNKYKGQTHVYNDIKLYPPLATFCRHSHKESHSIY